MNNFERIVGTILMVAIFIVIYMNKDNEKRLDQQIEKGMEEDYTLRYKLE